MASGGRGGTVLLWNVGLMQPISSPFPRPGLQQVHALLFHPDQNQLLVQYAGGFETKLVILTTSVQQYWEPRACGVAGRDISFAEWRRHVGEQRQEPICTGVPRPAPGWEPRPPAPF